MILLKNDEFIQYQIGKLAVLDHKDEDCTVYVLWSYDDEKNEVLLVEIDRPADGKHLTFNVADSHIYLLEPIDVVERVTEWKD